MAKSKKSKSKDEEQKSAAPPTFMLSAEHFEDRKVLGYLINEYQKAGKNKKAEEARKAAQEFQDFQS